VVLNNSTTTESVTIPAWQLDIDQWIAGDGSAPRAITYKVINGNSQVTVQGHYGAILEQLGIAAGAHSSPLAVPGLDTVVWCSGLRLRPVARSETGHITTAECPSGCVNRR